MLHLFVIPISNIFFISNAKYVLDYLLTATLVEDIHDENYYFIDCVIE